MKKHIRECNINARVVVGSGHKLISALKTTVNNCTCKICELGIPCKARNFVYEAQCKLCPGIYVGASARPASSRIGGYVSSIRLDSQTDRTTLAKHNSEEHNKTHDQIKDCYTFKILDKGRDPVDTFICEAINIKMKNKKHTLLNTNLENGFMK